MAHLTQATQFSLYCLKQGEATAEDISRQAIEAGINRRREAETEWAHLFLDQLCDQGLVERTHSPGVYRITTYGRKVSGQ